MSRLRSVVFVLSSLSLGVTALGAAAQGNKVPPGRPFQALESQITNNNAALSDLQSRVTGLEAQVAAIKAAVTQLDARVTANTNDIRNLLNTTQGLSGDLATLRAEHQAALQQVNAAIDDLTGRIVQAEASLTGLRSELESQLGQIQLLQGDVSGLTTQLAMLTAKVVLLEGTVSQQQQALTNLETARNQFMTQINGLTTRIDALEGRVTTLEGFHVPIPKPCDTGVDPRTNSPWIVCTADANEAWVSANNGGTYHAEAICQKLGYTRLVSFGGTCGNVCGYCQAPTSCTARGNRTMDGSGNQGTDDLGRILSFTVHWVCGK
jgi:predicted  nucleic acid-binding Zn-ribbon protein